MTSQAVTGIEATHPAPHRERVGLGLLFFGLLGAPFAWSLQLLINYGLASHVCFPTDVPLGSPMSGWVWPVLLVLNIAALVLAIVAMAVSYRNWRRVSEEAAGGARKLLEAGEGRTRFLSIWGVWAGIWFLFSIAFNTIAVLWVPLCGS